MNMCRTTCIVSREECLEFYNTVFVSFLYTSQEGIVDIRFVVVISVSVGHDTRIDSLGKVSFVFTRGGIMLRLSCSARSQRMY